MAETNYIAQFIKDQRSTSNLTQEELAAKAGVGLRFIRDLEQGKITLRMDKVNQVLQLFGYELIPKKELDPYLITREYFDRPVRVYLKNKSVLVGNIIEEIKENNEIIAWGFLKNNVAIEYSKTNDPKLITNILHKDIERLDKI